MCTCWELPSSKHAGGTNTFCPLMQYVVLHFCCLPIDCAAFSFPLHAPGTLCCAGNLTELHVAVLHSMWLCCVWLCCMWLCCTACGCAVCSCAVCGCGAHGRTLAKDSAMSTLFCSLCQQNCPCSCMLGAQMQFLEASRHAEQKGKWEWEGSPHWLLAEIHDF